MATFSIGVLLYTGVMMCFERCQRMSQCTAIGYITRDIKCHILAKRSLGSPMIDGPGPYDVIKEKPEIHIASEHVEKNYVEIVTNRNERRQIKVSGFGYRCQRNSSCDYPFGRCLYGFCSCQLGYSYDFKTGECLKQCKEFGNTFSWYKGVGVYKCNDVCYKERDMTESKCAEKCRTETRITCINAEYFAITCNLCSKTWYQLEPRQRQENSTDWSLIYRHC